MTDQLKKIFEDLNLGIYQELKGDLAGLPHLDANRKIWNELLNARREAGDKAVQLCGGVTTKDGTEVLPIRGVLVMLVREGAGIGFDEGVRFATQRLMRDG